MSNFNTLLSDLSISELRKEIECDHCKTINPTKRCSRCQLTYYCSVQCQREHWKRGHKADCIPIDEMKDKVNDMQNASSSLNDKQINDTLKTSNEREKEEGECQICSSKPMINPTLLSNCSHKFCYQCIMVWQKYYKISNIYDGNDTVKSTRKNDEGRCPCCRITIQKSIVHQKLEKAAMYVAAGRLMEERNHYMKFHNSLIPSRQHQETVIELSDRQSKFCQLAMNELDSILNDKPNHLKTLCYYGQIFRYTKPRDAIKAIEKALQLDQEGSVTVEQITQKMEEFSVKMEKSMSQAETDAINKEQESLLDKYEAMVAEMDPSTGIQIGSGPSRLHTVKIMLAEAYETLGQYDMAESIYTDMITEVHGLGYSKYMQSDAGPLHTMLMGAARCLYYLQDYERAIMLAKMSLKMNRHCSGIHILIAQSKWMLAIQENRIDYKKDAIRTMCRGILYETPWDNDNQQRNRTYLQELLDAYHSNN